MTATTPHIHLVHKIPISKPVAVDWKQFNAIAGDVLYNAVHIMNDAVAMHYLHQKEKITYKKKHGVALNVRKVYGVSSYTTIISRELKEKYQEQHLPGDLLEQIIRQAIDTFNTNASGIMKHNATLMTFRRDQPIPLRGRSLKLTGAYTVTLPLMSQEIAQKHGFTGKYKQSFEVQLNPHKTAKVILNRILDGTYEVSDSSVQKTKNNKWYLLLNYKQPVQKTTLNESTIVGVDLGISKAAYLAINNSKQNFFIDGGEVQTFRIQIRGRRKSLQHQLRVCSNNRRGHGKKTLLKPLETLRKKEANFNASINHRYAKQIVDWAEQQGAGTIQMENLSGVRESNLHHKILENWTYFDLASKIEYKAKARGLQVIKIQPHYTSQRCHYCGIIDKNNRVNQAVFHCQACNHKTNADLNAARNISLKNIETIIQEQLKVQKTQTKSI